MRSDQLHPAKGRRFGRYVTRALSAIFISLLAFSAFTLYGQDHYKEPGKEEKEKGSYPRKEYERRMAAPKDRLQPMDHQLLDQGCVGLCRLRQG